MAGFEECYDCRGMNIGREAHTYYLLLLYHSHIHLRALQIRNDVVDRGEKTDLKKSC